MSKVIVGAVVLAMSFGVALAQQPLPPGFDKGNLDKKWGGTVAPPGLTQPNANRDWQGTPPGWSNPTSKGWQNGPGTMGSARGRGR